MAQFTINVNNAIAADVRDTLAAEWGYPGDPSDNAAKMEFVRLRVAMYIKEAYRSAKAISSGESARVQSLSNTQNADIA